MQDKTKKQKKAKKQIKVADLKPVKDAMGGGNFRGNFRGNHI